MAETKWRLVYNDGSRIRSKDVAIKEYKYGVLLIENLKTGLEEIYPYSKIIRIQEVRD